MDRKKSQKYQADEYDSADDDELLETLIGRNRSKPNKKKQAQNKKNLRSQTPKPKKSATPRNNKKKTRDRAHSCPPGQTGRELWLAAVKNRQTAGLINSRHPESPRHKTTTEYWVDTLRKTGIGRSTESTGMNTFSGLKKPKERDMPYLSTSSYLRQMVGTEKTKKYDNPTTKPPMGTPAYRTPEEYYEQILELKKQIQSLNQDNGTLKAKVRRTEEDNIKKEKEIDGLLNPTKSEEMRRTLGDKRPDSGAMVHSLKQKILKLETQLRDREAALLKLQADLKTTKIDEMKVQLEACFHEIVRLQQSKDTGIEKSIKHKNEGGKMDKAVKDTIIRLNKQIEQLRSENKGLKQDLERDLSGTTGDYEDMDRKQLLSAIKKLEKRSKSRRVDDDDDDDESLYSAKRVDVKKGKLTLKGSMEERLDQLDKRETELLDTINKQTDTIKRLKIYRKRCEEKDKDIKVLEEELGGSGVISARRSPTPRTRPPSGRRASMESTMSDDRRSGKKSIDSAQDSAARKIQQGWKKKQSDREEQEKADYERRLKAAERLQEKHAVRTIEKNWTNYKTTKKRQDQEQADKIQNFREERAAKKIQKEWLVHKKRQYDDEVEDATELIQASMRGHKTRKGRMKKMRERDYDDSYSDEKEYDDAVNLIQSSFKGHVGRKKKLKRMEYDDDTGDDYEQLYTRNPSSASYKNRPGSLERGRPGSGERIRPGSGERIRPGSGSRPSSALSRGSISSKRSFTGSVGRTTTASYHQRMSDHEDDRHYSTGRTTPTGRPPYQRASDYDDDDDIEF
ncbi:IQ domain-containing protein E-like isoform X2 [Mizuhopecten yessoensis]|uniref:IQ domain-containing protein E-like isoform X2 n=1 Tax=Mizuhopecten yessoensis TaxID=6573 RepID=UPI000B45C0E5|nr:IQ domain-containing protein E-like isoform X2 [Mizuhopecten yessoensis]